MQRDIWRFQACGCWVPPCFYSLIEIEAGEKADDREDVNTKTLQTVDVVRTFMMTMVLVSLQKRNKMVYSS